MKTDFIEEYSKKRKQLDENYIKKKLVLDNDYKEEVQKLDTELEENMKKWNELKKKVLDSLDKFELKPKGNCNDFCSLNKTISQSSNLYNSPNSTIIHQIILVDQNANSNNRMDYPIKKQLDEEEIISPKQNDNNSNEPKESKESEESPKKKKSE